MKKYIRKFERVYRLKLLLLLFIRKHLKYKKNIYIIFVKLMSLTNHLLLIFISPNQMNNFYFEELVTIFFSLIKCISIVRKIWIKKYKRQNMYRTILKSKLLID